MDRIEEIDQEQLDNWRAANGNVAPGDLAVVDVPNCNIKADDHVMWFGFIPLIVYGPAPNSPGCFTGGHAAWFGTEVFAFGAQDVTDRIGPPPGNEGMPIYDEPEEEQTP